ncbi:MAG: PAS domain S-box protein [Spirochaetia bacterium]|jgi:PAS domain S-box-containing protein
MADTARLRPEEILQMYRFSIEQAADAIFWITKDAEFAYVNEQACRSLGYAREELLQLLLWDIAPLFTREQWAKDWAQSEEPASPEVWHTESWQRRKDGSLFPVEVSSKKCRVGEREFHVAFVRDITGRRQTEETMRFLQFAIDKASDAVFWMNADGGFPYVNEQTCQLLGYSREELQRLHLWDIDADFKAEKWREHWEELTRSSIRRVEKMHRRKDGSFIPVEISSSFVKVGDEEHRLVLVRDISARKEAERERQRLEAQLAQAQRMEAIGRLAGGVAHDFNNMLTVILGYVELIASRLLPGDPQLNDLGEIERAASRARDTTRQLLAFSRKQVIAPRPVQMNDLIRDSQNTLLRLIGEHIQLEIRLGEDLWEVELDPSQFHQILVNLAANARDAMPNGGKLRITTSNSTLTASDCSGHPGARPGPYALLRVSDDGVGMDEETKSHLFEPFFTTKEAGKGTGLGLATVYGTATANDGFIVVQSAPGRGSVLCCYFPRAKEKAVPTEVGERSPAGQGEGKVLLVEDEEMVRRMIASMLQGLGYSVVAAATPHEALSVLESPKRGSGPPDNGRHDAGHERRRTSGQSCRHGQTREGAFHIRLRSPRYLRQGSPGNGRPLSAEAVSKRRLGTRGEGGPGRMILPSPLI